MSFKSLGLSQPLLKAIAEKGYDTPSPIQTKAIPPILSERDVLASAQTGTGKTAAFTLPMLHLLTKYQGQGKRKIRALILTPTRELAAQVLEEVKTYSTHTPLKSTVIFGGVKQHKQVKALQAGVDILVATPGRLLDLCGQGFISLRGIEMFILDEADRMLDMGFLRDIKKVMGIMPENRQNLMFSATFSKEIKKLAAGILKNPVRVEATPENTTAELVKQRAIRVNQKRKLELLIKLILDGNWHQVLIFTRTKHKANRVSQKLQQRKITAAAIHGNKTQGARTRALAAFKSKEVSVLVATDIAARGLDIPLLPHVINFELPNVPEDYVHRIGRTGRAGANGEALSLVSEDEITYLQSIEKLLKQKIQTDIIEGFEPTKGPQEGGKKRNKQRQGNGGQGGGNHRPNGQHRGDNQNRNRSNNKNRYRGRKKKSNNNRGNHSPKNRSENRGD